MTSPTTDHLATHEVRSLLDGRGARLIDVRSPGEYASVRIPGSANVPLDMLRAHRAQLRAEHDDTVVLVCASGTRAAQARDVLENAGLTRVEVLRGGVSAWEQDGHEVHRGDGAWAMERQVRLTAGSLVLTGVLASLRYRPVVALAGAIGAGLTFSALTDTCAMARMLGKLPHNRRGEPDSHTAIASLTR